MGLGKKTGIDLTGEADGLIPDPKWKEKTTGERWFLGNTYHMAIGQGRCPINSVAGGDDGGSGSDGGVMHSEDRIQLTTNRFV